MQGSGSLPDRQESTPKTHEKLLIDKRVAARLLSIAPGTNTVDHANPSPRLALRPKEAARALGIGPRLLWTWTNQNLVPHARLGRAVIYPIDELRRWLSEQAHKNGRNR